MRLITCPAVANEHNTTLYLMILYSLAMCYLDVDLYRAFATLLIDTDHRHENNE